MKPQVIFILKVVTHHVVQYTFQQRNKEICFLRNQGIVFFTLLLSRKQGNDTFHGLAQFINVYI